MTTIPGHALAARMLASPRKASLLLFTFMLVPGFLAISFCRKLRFMKEHEPIKPISAADTRLRLRALFGRQQVEGRNQGSQPESANKTAGADLQRQASQEQYLAGVIEYQKGEHEKARAEWKKAMQLDPDNAEAAAGLKKVRLLYGDEYSSR